uniref:Uncharacterized protein n=1 Tax=Plectus sambesii TaxID=2011161 RepID=A0A914VSY0_9BILA
MLDSTLSVNFGENLTSVISTAAIYRALPIAYGIQQCSEEISHEACVVDCQLKIFEANCSCTLPNGRSRALDLNTSTSLDRLKTCGFEEISLCSAAFASIKDKVKDECSDNCLSACEHTRYKQLKTVGSSINATEAHFNISIWTFEYQIFSETFVWTFESFIAALGGLLGLWIGLSFLLLLRFVITPLLYLVNSTCSAKTAKHQ